MNHAPFQSHANDLAVLSAEGGAKGVDVAQRARIRLPFGNTPHVTTLPLPDDKPHHHKPHHLTQPEAIEQFQD